MPCLEYIILIAQIDCKSQVTHKAAFESIKGHMPQD